MISTFPLSTIHGMLTLNTKRLTQEEKQQLAFPTILLLDEYYFCISNIDYFFEHGRSLPSVTYEVFQQLPGPEVITSLKFPSKYIYL